MKKILLVAAFLGSLGLNVQAQNVEPLDAELVSITAPVDSVDLKDRVVFLKDGDNLVGIHVPKHIPNLKNVKKGDVLVVDYAQAVAVGLTAAGKGQQPGASGVTKVVVRGKGPNAKPFAETSTTVFATVKIESIDVQNRLVTFKLPNGEIQKAKVAKSVLGLEKFKAGDDVLVEFVDDLAIGFVTAKK